MDKSTTERWLPAVGLEGQFEVSDLGRVRSLTRSRSDGHRLQGGPVSVGLHPAGYPSVHIGGKTTLLQGVVAEAFLGPRPDRMVVLQRDGDLLNCAADNLFYGYRSRLSVQVGQRIGYAVVLNPAVRVPHPSRAGWTELVAFLRCDCGTEYKRPMHALVGKRANQKWQSCGCRSAERRSVERAEAWKRQERRPMYNFIDRTGLRYGRLTVIELAEKKPRTRWRCQCDCGNESTVAGISLTKGHTQSCGCLRDELAEQRRLPVEVVGRNDLLRSYQFAAKKRGHSWGLTDDEFDRLISQDCFYCGLPPSPRPSRASGMFVCTGIDRIDSSLGYVRSNVVPCCKTCNIAKNAMPLDDFMTWIGRLAAHQWFHPERLPTRLLKEAS